MTTAHISDKDALGYNVRRIRQHANLSQEKLSRISGVRAASLSEIENGLGDPKLSTLLKVAAALKVPVEDLFSLDAISD